MKSVLLKQLPVVADRVVADRGFTLIEVVVAMAIIALVVAQLSASMENNHFMRGRMEQKTLAHNLVMNRITELQVSDPPALGSQDDDAEFARQKWVINTTTKLAKPNVLQIDVSAGLKVEGGDPVMLDKVRMLKLQKAFWTPETASSQ